MAARYGLKDPLDDLLTHSRRLIFLILEYGISGFLNHEKQPNINRRQGLPGGP